MTGPRSLLHRCALPLVLLLGAAPLRAQPAELVRTDSLIADGRVEDARTTLQRWWDERWAGAPAAERERALWLRGRLTVDPSIARRDYMRLVLEHPGGPHTDDALLRLAQGAEATGRRDAAANHYEKLLREYPDSPHRLEARQWLEAHRAEVARERILGGAGDPEAPDPERSPREGRSDETPDVPPDEAGEAADAEPDGARPVALQLGAFRSERSARALLEEARDAGLDDVRLVRVEESDLIRVRVGRFADRASAAGRRESVEARGFEVLIVENADRERPPS